MSHTNCASNHHPKKRRFLSWTSKLSYHLSSFLHQTSRTIPNTLTFRWKKYSPKWLGRELTSVQDWMSFTLQNLHLLCQKVLCENAFCISHFWGRGLFCLITSKKQSASKVASCSEGHLFGWGFLACRLGAFLIFLSCNTVLQNLILNTKVLEVENLVCCCLLSHKAFSLFPYFAFHQVSQRKQTRNLVSMNLSFSINSTWARW